MTLNYTTKWTVAGSGNVPAFNYYHNAYVPTIGTLTSTTDIQTSGAYTISVASISGADSVVFVLAGPDASIQKVKAGNTTSCTFTAAEVATLGKGRQCWFNSSCSIQHLCK